MDQESWIKSREHFEKSVEYVHGVAVEEALSAMMPRMCDVGRVHGVPPVVAKIEASGSVGNRRLLASVGYRQVDGATSSAAIKAAQGMFGSSVKGVGIWTTVNTAPPNDDRLKASLVAIKEARAIKEILAEQDLVSSLKSI
jgi:hypothetical protein